MSTFAVTIERIESVWTHPNADRLDMARLTSMSYQFVIARGSYHVGDLVIYFPIDSVLPETIITVLGLTGKLAGPQHNRVKTVRLRGEISQGIVASPQELIPGWDPAGYREGQDITELLGVTKYEPPVIPSQAGNLVALPPLVSMYDIEGAERFGAQVEQYLMDKPVLITEKLEGSHFSASLYKAGEIAICQRRFRIEPVEGAEHDWHKAARTSGLLDVLPLLKAKLDAEQPSEVITVRAEMIGPGIQGNYYKLLKQQFKVFEIEVNGEPLPVQQYLALAEEFHLDTVPMLAVNVTLPEWLNGHTLAQASNGPSTLNPAVPREGVVIRPMQELRDETLGRVIIKQRSPEYLAISDY